MNPEQLQAWVQAHIDDLFRFMDYEPTVDDAEFLDTMGSWLDNETWASDDRFVHLGIDGTGSQVAVWVRAQDEQRPVVFFGSEGGLGVLTATPEAFALALAHAPYFESFEEPAGLAKQDDPLADKDDEEREEAQAAFERYRAAVRKELGDIPALQDLTTGLDVLNRELLEWVKARSPHWG